MAKRRRRSPKQEIDNRVYNAKGEDMGKKYPGMDLRHQRMFGGGMW